MPHPQPYSLIHNLPAEIVLIILRFAVQEDNRIHISWDSKHHWVSQKKDLAYKSIMSICLSFYQTIHCARLFYRTNVFHFDGIHNARDWLRQQDGLTLSSIHTLSISFASSRIFTKRILERATRVRRCKLDISPMFSRTSYWVPAWGIIEVESTANLCDVLLPRNFENLLVVSPIRKLRLSFKCIRTKMKTLQEGFKDHYGDREHWDFKTPHYLGMMISNRLALYNQFKEELRLFRRPLQAMLRLPLNERDLESWRSAMDPEQTLAERVAFRNNFEYSDSSSDDSEASDEEIWDASYNQPYERRMMTSFDHGSLLPDEECMDQYGA